LAFSLNGEVIGACSSEVARPASTGMLLQTYSVSSLPGASYLFATDLAPNSISFWTAYFHNGNTCQVDSATGAVLEQLNTGGTVSARRVVPSGVSDPAYGNSSRASE